jgi:hypothetical protein
MLSAGMSAAAAWSPGAGSFRGLEALTLLCHHLGPARALP